ncbi:ABC-type multidrug transport system, ATP-ase compoment CAC0241 [Streptococcus troglodytae]|uniref:ABC-type multidrug transport system, ATP-ase compoment CAC0241 n=1 Tax=Streptococcus troglodytae TaxID=1111760 RepID=A0A1L7LJB7_9STRE|nr:ABC transporter ATP-binding protein/permease [Streptococcus troglodytae]BAQ24305.1 ABC-type multidrug transport system, ATP-ase compoment CAC0241 [Streptococcus troglodytae]
MKGKELTDGVKEALDFVELWDRKNDLPGKYSGGMQRRLNIACAIVHKPQLIIMDEPTVGIDPHSRNHIMESIKRLNKLGSTIIYTSHYMEEVEALCDKVAIINYGKIVIEGTKDEIKHYVKEDKTLEVVLDKIEPQSIDQINKINSVKSCSYEENRLVIVISKTCDDISEIIKVLSRCNIKINHINMKEKHLEDIFLSVTEKILKNSGGSVMNILIIAKQELIRNLKDIKMIAILILFPILTIFILGNVQPDTSKITISVGYVNLDTGNEIGTALDHFLDSKDIKDKVDIVKCKSLNQVNKKLNNGYISCYIYLPKNLSEEIRNGNKGEITVGGNSNVDFIDTIINTFTSNLKTIATSRVIGRSNINISSDSFNIHRISTKEGKGQPDTIDYYSVVMLLEMLIIGAILVCLFLRRHRNLT